MDVLRQKMAAKAFCAKSSDPTESAAIHASFAFHSSLITALNVKLCQTCGRFLPRDRFAPLFSGSYGRRRECSDCDLVRHKTQLPGKVGESHRTALELVKAQRFFRFWEELPRLRAMTLDSEQLATFNEGLQQVRRRFTSPRDRLDAWKSEASDFGVEIPAPAKRKRQTRKHRRRPKSG